MSKILMFSVVIAVVFSVVVCIAFFCLERAQEKIYKKLGDSSWGKRTEKIVDFTAYGILYGIIYLFVCKFGF
jgi:hypothetical protein